MIKIIILIIAIIGAWGGIYLIGDVVERIFSIKNNQTENKEENKNGKNQ